MTDPLTPAEVEDRLRRTLATGQDDGAGGGRHHHRGRGGGQRPTTSPVPPRCRPGR